MLVLVILGLIGADGPPSLVAGPVELVTDGQVFSEGPLWLPDGRWIFSDIPQDAIFSADGSAYHRGTHGTNGMTLDGQGRLLMCQQDRHRVVRIERDGTETVLAASYNGTPLNAPNDLVVRSDGLVLFTDPMSLRGEDDDGLGFSGVYAVGPDGAGVALLTREMHYPNGIGLSPDERTLYVADTRGGIRAYDLHQDGTVSNGRDFAEVRIPDGMAVDRAGRIWTSSSSGIVVLGPDGAVLERVGFEGMPTNCAFGDADGKTLLITARKRVYRVRTKEPGIVPALVSAATGSLQSPDGPL